MSDYRHIGFISTQYKIIEKLFAIRLTKVIDSLINPVQSAFIKDLQILGVPLILNEAMNWIKKIE